MPAPPPRAPVRSLLQRSLVGAATCPEAVLPGRAEGGDAGEGPAEGGEAEEVEDGAGERKAPGTVPG